MTNDLGTAIKTINLSPNYLRPIAVVLFIAGAVSVFFLLLGVKPWFVIGGVVGGGLLILVVISAILSWLFLPVSQVTVYENGMVAQRRAISEVILWKDIVGLQANTFSETAYTPQNNLLGPFLIFFSWILIVFVILVQILNPGGKAYTRAKSFFVFHLRNGGKLELAGDERLFVLQDHIRDKVVPRLNKEIHTEFERGQMLPLATGLSYSTSGIQGVYERKAGRAYLKSPIDLKWAQIRQIHRFDQTMKIEAEGSKTITLGLSGIRNLSAFISISKEQAEKYHFKHVGF